MLKLWNWRGFAWGRHSLSCSWPRLGWCLGHTTPDRYKGKAPAQKHTKHSYHANKQWELLLRTGKAWGWRDRDPEFGSQHLHNGSYPPVTVAPKDLTPSSGLHAHCTHVYYSTPNTHTILKGFLKNYFFFKRRRSFLALKYSSTAQFWTNFCPDRILPSVKLQN